MQLEASFECKRIYIYIGIYIYVYKHLIKIKSLQQFSSKNPRGFANCLIVHSII